MQYVLLANNPRADNLKFAYEKWPCRIYFDTKNAVLDFDKMFELVTMKDDVKIEPHNFGDAIATAVEKELNRKLANKVYHNHGLCIILYDILEIGDSLILPGDGAWDVFEIKSLLVEPQPISGLEVVSNTEKLYIC